MDILSTSPHLPPSLALSALYIGRWPLQLFALPFGLSFAATDECVHRCCTTVAFPAQNSGHPSCRLSFSILVLKDLSTLQLSEYVHKTIQILQSCRWVISFNKSALQPFLRILGFVDTSQVFLVRKKIFFKVHIIELIQ